MANPEHVEIILAGADAVRQWRYDNPNVQIDLSNADLSGANLVNLELSNIGDRRSSPPLAGADFSGVNLHGAQMRGCNLRGALMPRARLSHAEIKSSQFNFVVLDSSDFSGATIESVQFLGSRLSNASFNGCELDGCAFGLVISLMESDLWCADLDGVDFTQSIFQRSEFRKVSLNHADFTGSVLEGVTFEDTDLSRVIGLDSLRFIGPCSLDIHTLFRSQASLSDEFLRGCGVPEILIEYLPSLAGVAIDVYSCFISHSSRNEDFTRRLHSRMQQEKLRVWYAPEDMRGGRKSIDQIDRAIRIYDKLLLVLSRQSMDSEWVRVEIKKARQEELRTRKQKLFPIRVCSLKAIRDWECFDSDTGQDLAAVIREYHIPDFSKWKEHDTFERAFAELLRDLRADES